MRHLGLILTFAGLCIIATTPTINGLWILGAITTTIGLTLTITKETTHA